MSNTADAVVSMFGVILVLRPPELEIREKETMIQNQIDQRDLRPVYRSIPWQLAMNLSPSRTFEYSLGTSDPQTIVTAPSYSFPNHSSPARATSGQEAKRNDHALPSAEPPVGDVADATDVSDAGMLHAVMAGAADGAQGHFVASQ